MEPVINLILGFLGGPEFYAGWQNTLLISTGSLAIVAGFLAPFFIAQSRQRRGIAAGVGLVALVFAAVFFNASGWFAVPFHFALRLILGLCLGFAISPLGARGG